MSKLEILMDFLTEILRPNQDWDYRWFRFRELIGWPPYDPNDGYEEELNDLINGKR